MSFARDDAWQRSVRDRFLLPYYERIAHNGKYVVLDGVASRLQPVLQGELHVDTLVQTRSSWKVIEEKFVRWPGYEYDSYALETKSCTNSGRQSDGWIKTCKADVLCYVFTREHDVLAHFIPLPELQDWFEDHQGDYRVWRATRRNRTECRIVPIRDLWEAMPRVHTVVLREEVARSGDPGRSA